MDAVLLALIEAGLVSREDAERITRRLDPLAAQQWAERVILESWEAGLISQQSRLLQVVRGGTVPDAAFWAQEDEALRAAITPAYQQVAQEFGVIAAIDMGVDTIDAFNLVDEGVLSWVEQYYASDAINDFGSIPNLNETSRKQVGEAFNRWSRGEFPIDQGSGIDALIAELQPTFGPQRAEAIAVTETTRIIAYADQAAADVNPNIELKQLSTARDEFVCPICWPMHMTTVNKAADFVHPKWGPLPGPPFHPRCRCRPIFVTAAVAAIPATVE